MPTNREPESKTNNNPAPLSNNRDAEDMKKLISKAELLENVRYLVDERIARLKELLTDIVLSGENFLEGMNFSRVKERIHNYQKIETLLCEVIENLFEREEACQDKN